MTVPQIVIWPLKIISHIYIPDKNIVPVLITLCMVDMIVILNDIASIYQMGHEAGEVVCV